MSINGLGKSLSDAWKGICYVFKHEQNFRLQIYTSVLVLIAVWYFDLAKAEMVVIFLLIILVLILELLNSAVEKMADVLKPRLSLQIHSVKDIMAGMVLISSLGALIVGIIIFYPHVVEWVNSQFL